jgi:lipopolysaccharide exporter
MWVFTLRIIDQLFRLVRTLVLARLLVPADFGLFGIALLAMSALETFSETGFDAALVQKKEDTKSYLDTAWTVQVIRGVVLALIIFIVAPYVAAFFNAPAAMPILKVIAFSVLLGGFGNIGVVYFQKELEFHKQFIYVLSGTIADIGVAITAALLLRSVWALVLGLLARTFAQLFVSYLIQSYRPQFYFNNRKFKELFRFGKWLLFSSIIIFLLHHGDDAFVGKVLGVSALGLYQLAYRLSNLPATEITHVLSQVTFPAYSKLQDNLHRLREAYFKVISITSFLSFPIAGLIFVFAPDFTRIFLGDKWMPMVPAMKVLCVFGMTRAINATFGAIYMGMGKPKFITYAAGFQLVLLAAIIYPLTQKWGILGTSTAVVTPNLIVLIYLSRKLAILLKCDLGRCIGPLFIPLVSSMAMCTFAFLLRSVTKNFVPGLGVSVLAAIGLYFGIVYVSDSICKGILLKNLKSILDF